MLALRDERQYCSNGILTCYMCFDDHHLTQCESTCLVKHGVSCILGILSRNCGLHTRQPRGDELIITYLKQHSFSSCDRASDDNDHGHA